MDAPGSRTRGGWPALASITALLLAAGSIPRTGEPAGAARCAAQDAPEPSSDPLEWMADLRVELRPRRVFCGSLITLSLRAEIPPEAEAEILWSASGGRLWFDDLPEVQWRAPRTAGAVRIAADVAAGGERVRRTLAVEVHRPSTEGMVHIPAGIFLRGDIPGTLDTREIKTVQNYSDEPHHEVYLDAFWIDRHPVTNRRFAAFLADAFEEGLVEVGEVAVMGELEGSWVPFYYFQPYDRLIESFYRTRNSQPTRFLHLISWDGERFRVREGHEDHPAVDVTWYGSAAYANYYGKMLPSEAQWEKAARGDDRRIHPWGDNLPTAYHASVDGKLAPVGTHSPAGDSPYGVADMAIPAFEWTNDWWNTDFYDDYLADTPHPDPRGPFWGTSHSIRGFPGALEMRIPSIERMSSVTTRYNWRFEYYLGDSFANHQSAFRTVVEAAIAGTPPRRASAREERASGD
ncbi:MAG: SUMF1/EgtB/PvdO family nonheme iron enzyme [Planctomycetes bacterium]|nr:SUMF1/EgtB/PvdO family nonheme iron enzyme [Planctomycetota bacterium]